MSSQVVTFYEDEAKTNALYPRTKVSAISDDDGKALSETISKLNTKTRINYLRPTLQTTTKNGVTCTNNGDGTYTLNGTCTSETHFFIGDLFLKSGTYKYVGCPSNGSLYKYYLANFIYNGTTVIKNVYDYGDGANFEVDSNTYRLNTRIIIYSGTQLNNIVFKPMITDDLSATYDDFISYFDCLTPDIKMDLLWTNASPSSAFNAQTVSLDLSRYKYIIIIYSYVWADGLTCALCPIGEYTYLVSGGGTSGLQTGKVQIAIRKADVTTTGVVFKNASSHTVEGHSNNNGFTIPYRIYGVR